VTGRRWALPDLFSSDGFMPHGHCYLWNPRLVWLHVVSDGIIALAYMTIPFTLVYLARKRRDIPFNGIFFSFGMFIIACGATHMMEVWTLWTPLYWLSGAVKAVTAAASVATAIFLVRIVPRALAIPRSNELLEAHEKLRGANAVLENRTSELSATLREREGLLREKTALLEEVHDRAKNNLELRAVVDNLPELAWTARPDGFIDFYNRRWYDYTGRTYEDMQGWGWQSVHDPHELPRVMERWTRSIATREPFDQAAPLRRRDGVFRWFLSRGTPMFDEAGELVRWVGISTDIEEQRQAQEVLRQTEEERARLVEQLQTSNTALEDRVRSRTAELSETLREREALLKEKTSLLQEVHHRVKNNLQVISSLLNLQARQIHQEEARAIFVESQGRVRSIALLHESLYQSSDLGQVDMQEYVDKLVTTLKRTYRDTSSGVRFVTSIDRVFLPMDTAVPCGLIVNELVTNALKHAFVQASDSTQNEIHVEMRRTGDELTLLVADNGSGFSTTVDPAREETMGLTLIGDLSAQLRGEAELATTNGTRCTVRFLAPRGENGGRAS
jgi:PAS domain S-box-containing protein